MYTVLLLTAGPEAGSLDAGFLDQPDIRVARHHGADGAAAAIRGINPDLIVQDLPPEDDRRLAAELARNGCGGIPSVRFFAESAPSGERPGAVLGKPVILREYFEAVGKFVTLPRRRALRHEVNLRFVYEDDAGKHHAFSRDLSVYGAFLKTDRLLAEGTRLRLTFRLPGQPEEIRCQAQVCQGAPVCEDESRSHGFGVEFQEMDSPGQRRLEKFIERNRPRGVFSRALG